MIINYIASSGNTYNLSASRVFTKEAKYHTWTFEPQVTSLMYGERVSSFKKDAAVYQTTLIITGSITERKAIITALHDDFENDVRNLSPGRIMFGDWYCDCYITASTTTPDDSISHWTQNEITIYVPSGFWVKEEYKEFSLPEPEASEFLDYTYDYDYDYFPPPASEVEWETDSPFPSDFLMRINGPCVNPRVTVNGYPYVVYASIPDGEVLAIDSKNHTVMMGEQNLFDARNKLQSVFEKMPAGNLTLSWEGFTFDITLYEERSEAKW